MAGKFLSLEEAARHLGVTIDEINRLVDRKKLFPMRDGATVKFKIDDIERVAADMGDEGSAAGGDLALDLELSSPSIAAGSAAGSGLGDDLVLGDAVEEVDSIFGDDAGEMPSRTIVQPKGGDAVGGDEDLVIGDAGSALASSDLELDSIISASSPSVVTGSPAASDAGSDVIGGSGTLAIDLGSGSIAGLSGPAPAALSGGIGDSGLSLEGPDLAASGLDLGGSGLDLGGSGVELGGPVVGSGIGSGIGSGVDNVGGGLGGDAFELGDSTTDDESASVVIATEEGDSSFFGAVTDDSGSVSIEDASAAALVGGEDAFLDAAGGPPFSVLQIVGLICCTLFLLTCALVMIDLVWFIRAPAGEPVSSPLLKALTDLFSWR